MKRSLSNGVTTFGPAGTPTTIDIKRTGILRALQALIDGTATFTPGTGTVTRDVLGPWNLMAQWVLAPNQQAPIMRLSGYGKYIDDFMRSIERNSITPDTVIVSETSADPLADVFSAGGTTSGDWRYFQDIPVSQLIRSLGTEIGLWPLENPAVQLQLSYTPVGTPGGVSPFNIASTTATQAPYLVTGPATATLANPTIDLRRDLWEVPANAGDNPPYTFVITTLEETPQSGNVNGAATAEWRAMPLSGVLLRLATFILDGGTAGVTESKLSNANSLVLLFGADTQKFSETGQAAHARMADFYGASPPQGVFAWDFLGRDLTLQDVLDTYTTPEIRLDYNFSAALGGAGSAIKVIREMLVPLEIQAA